MKAVLYLVKKQFKNYLINYKYNISKLAILVIFTVFLMLSLYSDKVNIAQRDLSELYSICFAFYLTTFIIISCQGLRPGLVYFNNADIGLLFPSPIKQSLVLLYGFAKKTWISLYLAILVLLLLPWLKVLYDISLSSLIIILICYITVIAASVLTAMIIYLYSDNNKYRQNLIKLIIYIFCAFIFFIIALPALVKIMTGKSILQAVVLSSSAPIISLIPVAGWLQALTASWFIKNKVLLIISAIPLLVYIFISILIILKNKSNFYEDVICRSEVKNNPNDSEHISKTSNENALKKGRKASAYFYKQIIENKRQGILFFDRYSAFYVILTLIFALFAKEQGLIYIFAFSVFISALSTSAKNCINEFDKHFIYMAPYPVYKKLFYICAYNILKIAAESGLVFVLAGLIVKAPVLDIAVCILARISFGILYIATGVIIEKLIKTNINRIILTILHYLAFLTISLPGLAAGLLIAAELNKLAFISCIFLTMTVFNIIAIVLILLLSKNLLNYARNTIQ